MDSKSQVEFIVKHVLKNWQGLFPVSQICEEVSSSFDEILSNNKIELVDKGIVCFDKTLPNNSFAKKIGYSFNSGIGFSNVLVEMFDLFILSDEAKTIFDNGHNKVTIFINIGALEEYVFSGFKNVEVVASLKVETENFNIISSFTIFTLDNKDLKFEGLRSDRVHIGVSSSTSVNYLSGFENLDDEHKQILRATEKIMLEKFDEVSVIKNSELRNFLFEYYQSAKYKKDSETYLKNKKIRESVESSSDLEKQKDTFKANFNSQKFEEISSQNEKKTSNSNNSKKKIDVGSCDYYRVLGLNETASFDEIRNSYRKMIKLTHPDMTSDPYLNELAIRLNLAYDTLGDTAKRNAYDTFLKKNAG